MGDSVKLTERAAYLRIWARSARRRGRYVTARNLEHELLMLELAAHAVQVAERRAALTKDRPDGR